MRRFWCVWLLLLSVCTGEEKITADDIGRLMLAVEERAYAIGGPTNIVWHRLPVWSTSSRKYAEHTDPVTSNITYVNYKTLASFRTVARTNTFLTRQAHRYYTHKGKAVGRFIAAEGSQAVVRVTGDTPSVSVYGRVAPRTVFCGVRESYDWASYYGVEETLVVHFAGTYALAMDAKGRWVIGEERGDYLEPYHVSIESERGLSHAKWASWVDGQEIYYEPELTVTPSGTTTNFGPIEAYAMEYSPSNYVSGIQVTYEDLRTLDEDILSMVPRTVDDSRAVGGNFDAYFSAPNVYTSQPSGDVYTNYATALPLNTITGLFARLGIGDHTNQFLATEDATLPARQVWRYAFVNYWPSMTPTPVVYTSDYQQAVNYASAWNGGGADPTNFTWSVYSNAVAITIPASNVPATYGSWPLRPSRECLLEREKLVAALKWTTAPFYWTNQTGDLYVNTSNRVERLEAGGEESQSWSPAEHDAWWAQTAGMISWWEDTGSVFRTPAEGWDVTQSSGTHTTLSNGVPELSFVGTWMYEKTQHYVSRVYVFGEELAGNYHLPAPSPWHEYSYRTVQQRNNNTYINRSASPGVSMSYWPRSVPYELACYAKEQVFADGTYGVAIPYRVAFSATKVHDGHSTHAELSPFGYTDEETLSPVTVNGFGSSRDGVFVEGWPSDNEMYYIEHDTWGGSTNRAYGKRCIEGPALFKWTFQHLPTVP